MRLKITPLILFFILNLSSLTWSALIMKDDGTSMNCIVDSEQAIKIKTSSGEITLKLNDINWIAGDAKGIKRVRTLNKYNLIIGEVDKKEIQVKKGDDNLLISPSTIIFFYHSDIDLETVGTLEIEEYDSGSFIATSYAKKDNSKEFKVRLFPENWEGNIIISNPSYDKKELLSKSSLTIAIDIQGDNGLFADISKKADILSIAIRYRVTFDDTHNLHSSLTNIKSYAYHDSLEDDRDYYLRFNKYYKYFFTVISYQLNKVNGLPNSIDKKARIAKYFSHPFYERDSSLRYRVENEVYGNGFLYLYFFPHDNKTEELGEGNLEINKTVSNILRLPITIFRSSEEKEVAEVRERNEARERSAVKVHIYIIIIDSQTEAESILLQLKKGEAFNRLAKEKSVGPNRENGGDLGYIFLSDLKQEFQNALKDIKEGQFTKIFLLDSKFAILYLESINKPELK